MRYSLSLLPATLAVAGIMILPGCPQAPVERPAAVEDSGHDDQEHGDHAHGEHGPHDGHLIELGRQHKYHAELVEDHDVGVVRIYILDGAMKELPIEQEQVSLTLTIGAETKNFNLTAVDATDGRTAVFESKDEALHRALDEEKELTGKLRVTIDGTPQVGEIHHHAHHDH